MNDLVDDTPSPLGLDYYRRKAQEFEDTLRAMDAAYRAANYALASGALDDASAGELMESIAEYDARRTSLRLTAEAINAGAALVNTFGADFKKIQLPGTLGLAPVAPVALIGAVGAAVALISWGVQWIAGVNERLKRAQLLGSASPEQRDAIVRAIADSDNAVSQAESSTLAAIAPALKWVAIGVLGFLAYRAFAGRN